ncbi:MAG: peptide chain release factor N(5)-glutamine methyltransferase [Acidimicrobiales bacterium]
MSSPMRSSPMNERNSSARRAEAPTWRALVRAAATALDNMNEALILAEETADVPRASLVLAFDSCPGAKARARFRALVDARRRGAPFQHVVGHWGFRTLDLVVDGRALVPRPETEFTVEVALAALAARRSPAAQVLGVDLGTGSGAIACSLVAELATVSVVATDCSPGALEVAAANRARLDPADASRLELRLGDWYGALDPAIAGHIDLIVANPPYLAASEWHGLDPVVRDHDPAHALVAGPSGREAIEEILRGAPVWLSNDAAVVVEIAPHQAREAVAFASRCGARKIEVRRDLAGRDRVIVARW